MAAMDVWPTGTGDGQYATEARWRQAARGWATSGVMIGASDELEPSLAAGDLTIEAGVAWVDGVFCELAAPATFTAVDDGLAVVRFDPPSNTATLLYRTEGVVPSVSRFVTTEIPIAKIVGGALVDARHLVHPLIGGRAVAYDVTAPWYQVVQSGLAPDRAGMSAWVIDTEPGLGGQWVYDGTTWILPGLAGTPQPPGTTYVLKAEVASAVYLNTTTEVQIGWFNVPLTWKEGDRLHISTWGSMTNPMHPTAYYVIRLYMHSDVGVGQILFQPPQVAGRRGWFVDWEIHQEGDSVWVQAFGEFSAPHGNVDGQGDNATAIWGADSRGLWVNPQLDDIVGYPVRLQVAANVAPAGNDLTFRGWRVEHLVA